MRYRFYMPFLVALLLLQACGAEKPADNLIQVEQTGPVVATVLDESIHQDLLDAYARVRGIELDSGEKQQQALVNLQDLLFLAQNARENGISTAPDFLLEQEIRRLTIISNLAIRDYLSRHPITDEQVQTIYNMQVSRAGNTQYKLHHILLASEEEAAMVMEKLAAGEAFSKIENDYLQVSSGSDVGDLGWVDASQVPPEIASVLPQLVKGESWPEPVKTMHGFHMLYLEDKRERTIPPLEQVADGIRASLQRKLVEEFLAGLRQQSVRASQP